MALHNSANVMYLEAFVEGTGTLPTELQRILNTIKALDEKCNDLSAEVQANTSTLLSLPPAYQQPGPEYEEVLNRVAASQKMLLQFADEKVQLAQQAHDLLEMHALELERVTDDLEKELRKNNPDGGLDYLQDFTLDTGRGKTPRLDEFNMSLQQELSLPPPPAAAPAAAPKKAAAAANVASKGKRPRDEDGGAGGAGGGAPTPAGPQAVKKKASTAAPLNSQPSTFEDYQIESLPAYEEPGAAAEANPVPFMRPPPAGYKASSSRPQASTGGNVRYLMLEDIGDGLVGRHAELFWPDDNLWYLIEIQEVYVAQREARVLYSTGDFETLSLEETARDMHMVLIPDQLY
ncbi:hypothetical protein HYH02_012334 [Chlamydomonas schloesseri]|uniref:Inhibitor of growth protein N-terminal histone-binding domain-containing protein n=1 Tax=Chlamydomonas schloesseri TaxID=2026947 RepID=A0A835SZH0_9CHLO|nr:hypothetical protein HYH02_012334 [Chlamydomonas schloesseri]|eukprot:KAG2434312.1 hypothetical protein HYH02_012334 [Chlamydomonas schloesseri]